ncbi:hypothetical protein RJ641_026316 [Dillenia turbinata]|uniref:Uncharacterized protein n=1 Tax=Dillenia turbinata TaxID=194707 RepID=A0AAN8W8P5_9MAGN
MQDTDPNLPGFYQKRKIVLSEKLEFDGLLVEDVLDHKFDEEEKEGDFDNEIDGELEVDDEEFDNDDDDVFEWNEDDWEAELDDERRTEVGYGNISEETIEKGKKKRRSKAERMRMAREAQKEIEEVAVCACCQSLRNYGQVKNHVAENLIPDFDFDRFIAIR